MPARFTTLENEFKKGLDKVAPDAGAKQVEYWLGELKSVEVSGVKGLTHDLESLKKHLEADSPDASKIGPLLGKIGAETGRIASHVKDEKVAEKLKHVAEMLEPFHKAA